MEKLIIRFTPRDYKKISECMDSKGISLKNLASSMDIDQGQLSRILRGKIGVRPYRIKALYKAMGSPAELKYLTAPNYGEIPPLTYAWRELFEKHVDVLKEIYSNFSSPIERAKILEGLEKLIEQLDK